MGVVGRRRIIFLLRDGSTYSGFGFRAMFNLRGLVSSRRAVNFGVKQV